MSFVVMIQARGKFLKTGFLVWYRMSGVVYSNLDQISSGLLQSQKITQSFSEKSFVEIIFNDDSGTSQSFQVIHRFLHINTM